MKSGLRIAHVSNWYFPESAAGTETYLASLVRELTALGIKSVIAAPILGLSSKEYEHEGTPVFRYPIGEHRTIAKIRGLERHDHFSIFESWLRAQRCDVYHQHSWTAACGL